MDDNSVLTNEQYLKLHQEINFADQTGDRTTLNQLLGLKETMILYFSKIHISS